MSGYRDAFSYVIEIFCNHVSIILLESEVFCMKIIELYDIDKDIKLNQLKEVTSTAIYTTSNHYNPQGLFSEEIFGQTEDERTYRCGYIKLPIHVFNPGVAKTIIMRSGGIIKKMAYAEVKCNLVDGVLIADENGQYTGIKDLYEIWDQIDIRKTLKSKNEKSLDILTKSPKRLIFNDKVLVVPPNMRRIVEKNGKQSKSELNSLYIKLLGLKSVTQYTTTSVYKVYNSIQDTLIAIYVYFNTFVAGKNGFFQKNLLAKTTVGIARNVISCPSYRSTDPDVGIFKTGYPLHSICAMFLPFIKFHMKQFLSYDNLSMIHPNPQEVNRENIANIYDDKTISDLIKIYELNPGSRYRILYLDPEKTKPIMFSAIRTNDNVPILRPFTLTDLVYLAAYNAVVVPDRMVYLVRYPIGKYLGAFFTGVFLMSTINTVSVQYQGVTYKRYPDINPDMSHARVSTQFVDVVNMTNSRLVNIGGDYDGDTIKSTGIWSDEANENARKLMKSKIYLCHLDGTSCFPCEQESLNGLYGLTKM